MFYVQVDQSGRQTDAATPFISTAETTTVNDEFLYAFGTGNAGGADVWTPGNSFIMQDNVTDGANFWAAAQGTRIVTGTGTYNSSWTCGASTATVQWIATFSEAPAAAILQQQNSGAFFRVIE